MSDTSQNNHSDIIAAQNAPFKYAVFSGGGAKGALYSGAYEALAKNDMISGLDAVAGSSAGALTAAMIATGMSHDKYTKMTTETNIKGLLGNGLMPTNHLPLNMDGKPLLELLKTSIASNIGNYLQNTDIDHLISNRLSEIHEQQELIISLDKNEQEEYIKDLQKQETKLLELVQFDRQEIKNLQEKISSGGPVLFKDLALLRTIDPNTFKELVITATRKDTGELKIFDTQNTPDVEIALACRASSSFPIVFEPVMIDENQYIDGGYRDNIPLNYFHQKDKKFVEIEDEYILLTSPDQQNESRTLALAFAEDMDGEANIAIYSTKAKITNPYSIIDLLKNLICSIIARIGGPSRSEEETYQNLRQNALNTVALDPGEIGTLSFDLASEKSEYTHIKGLVQTSRYLENHSLTKIKDENLENKEFLLKLYEESQSQNLFNKWTNQFFPDKQDKLGVLITACHDATWNNKSKTEVLTDIVKFASFNKRTGKLSADTATTKNIIKILNDPSTPNIIKKDFIETLNIDKAIASNIAQFKFTEKDFDKFLEKHQNIGSESPKKSHTNKVKEDKRKGQNNIKSRL